MDDPVQVAFAAEMKEHNRLLEAVIHQTGKLVSFEDELCDAQGNKVWEVVGLDSTVQGASALAYRDQSGFDAVRNRSRAMAVHNEFALSAYENRISYIAGEGHVYSVTAKKDTEVAEAELEAVSAVIDEFIKVNKWHARQQEMVRRRDRDGEAFLRYFPGTDGVLKVRFVEPGAIRNRLDEKNPDARFGIIFDPEDAETALAYIIHKASDNKQNPEPTDADEIQHRKANVDFTSPRGLPILFPVEKNLTRAEKLLRNLGALGAMRAAFALIRKHASGAKASIQTYASDRADLQIQNSTTGKTANFAEYPAGSILDTGPNTEYEFPAMKADMRQYVFGLQAELRAAAARLNMPEFMFTADASNGNFASTLVAEGPAVKMFEREQAAMIEDDLEVMERAVATAIVARKLPEDVLTRVDITAEGPQVRTRDHKEEAEANGILRLNGVISRATMAARHQLDFEEEKERMEEEGQTDEGFVVNAGSGDVPGDGVGDERTGVDTDVK